MHIVDILDLSSQLQGCIQRCSSTDHGYIQRLVDSLFLFCGLQPVWPLTPEINFIFRSLGVFSLFEPCWWLWCDELFVKHGDGETHSACSEPFSMLCICFVAAMWLADKLCVLTNIWTFLTNKAVGACISNNVVSKCLWHSWKVQICQGKKKQNRDLHKTFTALHYWCMFLLAQERTVFVAIAPPLHRTVGSRIKGVWKW